MTAQQASEAYKKHSTKIMTVGLNCSLEIIRSSHISVLKITSLPDVCRIVCVCVPVGMGVCVLCIHEEFKRE